MQNRDVTNKSQKFCFKIPDYIDGIKGNDSIRVMIAPPEFGGLTYSVHRWIDYSQTSNPPTRQDMLAALAEKYGQPTDGRALGGQNTYWCWNYYGGNPAKRCSTFDYGAALHDFAVWGKEFQADNILFARQISRGWEFGSADFDYASYIWEKMDAALTKSVEEWEKNNKVEVPPAEVPKL